MLQKINYEEAPCEDFYNFACGRDNFIKENNNENLIFELYRSTSSNLNGLETFKKFHTSCMDHGLDFNYAIKISKGLPHL